MGARRKSGKRSGQAVVETALMMPWIAFLFVGVLDFGFYSYAAISVQNAARAAALRSANSQYSFSSTTSCIAALGELRGLPNMAGVTSCDALPAIVVITPLNSGTSPQCADCVVTPGAASVQAAVTYQTIPMVPIPGLVVGQVTLTRKAEARVLVR